VAGGGVQGGRIYGSSDKIAASPIANPISPVDLLATMYHLLGIDAGRLIYDQEDRPSKLAEGRVVHGLL